MVGATSLLVPIIILILIDERRFLCLYIEVFGLFVVPFIYKAGWEKQLMLAGKDTTPMGE